MKRRVRQAFAFILSLAMLTCVLSGCGNSSVEESVPGSPGSTQPTEVSGVPTESAGNSKEVTMPAGFDKSNVQWVVPAAAGTAVDITARMVNEALGSALGASVVIENLAGASQTIGAAEFSARQANGHNLLILAPACYITQPLMSEVAYDPADWRVICSLSPDVFCCIASKAGSAIATTDDLIEKIKSGNFTCGVSNAGSLGHLSALETLNLFDAIGSGTLVFYNGSAELNAAVLSGEVDFAMMDDSEVYKYTSTGEMEFLLSCSAQPSTFFPDGAYAGQYDADFVDIPGFKCLAVLKDTPEDEVGWIKQQINAALVSDSYTSYLESCGLPPMEVANEAALTARLDAVREVCKEVMRLGGLID